MRYPTQFERDKINDPLYLVAFWRRPAREQHTMYRTMLNLFLQKGVPRFSQDKTLGLSVSPRGHPLDTHILPFWACV
jgi:hypothetical protein